MSGGNPVTRDEFDTIKNLVLQNERRVTQNESRITVVETTLNNGLGVIKFIGTTGLILLVLNLLANHFI